MPSLGFTLFRKKILSGEKKQTIRAVSKRVIKPGDSLFLYWHLRRKDCELLKKTKCVEALKVTYRDFAYNDEIARKDGFKDSKELRKWFQKVHHPFLGDQFYIIRWE